MKKRFRGAAVNVAERLRALMARAGFSQAKLASEMGYSRKTSIGRYLSPEYMGAEKYPADFVARLDRALIGRGHPAISKGEIWELAEPGASIVISRIAVTLVPVISWEKLRSGAEMLKILERVDSIEIPGLPAGNYVAAVIQDTHAETVAPEGSTIILNLNATDLRAGKRYVVILDGEPQLRRYQQNPERWESEAAKPDAAIYPREALHVIGQLIRTVKEW